RQQLARLGEENHDHPHDDPDGRAIDVGGIDVGAALLEHFAMGLYEDLDGGSDPLAEYGRQLGLALSAIEDGLEEGRIRVAIARPERRLEERPEGRHLRRHLAFLKPEVHVPLAPGVEIDPGEYE